jgi:hypothetical protein
MALLRHSALLEDAELLVLRRLFTLAALKNCQPNVRLREGAGVEEFAPADLQAVNVGDVADLERVCSS